MRRSQLEQRVELLRAVQKYPQYSLTMQTQRANINSGVGVKWLKQFAENELVILRPWKGNGRGQSAVLTVYGLDVLRRFDEVRRSLE